MRKQINYMLRNRRTTFAGLVIFALLALYFFNYIDKEKAEYIILTLTAFGFILSKDSDKP